MENKMSALNITTSQHATRLEQRTSGSGSFVIKLLRMIGRILALFLTLILCLPVVLLPLTTAVPAWLWILLGILDIVLVALQFRLVPAWRGIAVSIGSLLLVNLIAVIASQVYAQTPPIVDEQGKPIPGSIASLEKINLNGSEQWITIRGEDTSKPVLLHLGMGGPGGGGFATRSLFEPLEKDFVVVSWDEPGTGKSYNAVPISTLTPQRFIEDAHALTLCLRERFHQDKIYVYGVSWTSILGVWLVQQYPELYYAYIGNGQMVNTTENDILGYELAINYLTKKGDFQTVEELRRNGPPPYTGKYMVGKYVAYMDVLNEYMGALPFTVVVPIIPFLAPEYGYVDKINHTRGLMESFEVVYPQLADLDFTTQAPKLNVPVYLFAGRNDVNAMSSIVENYYNILEAPNKELIWLNGGHGLDDRNVGQFVDVLVNTVKAEPDPNK
jgi:pimeloyl-ACP methyl ester carboxylesterase